MNLFIKRLLESFILERHPQHRPIRSILRGFPKVGTQVSAAKNSTDCVKITEAHDDEVLWMGFSFKVKTYLHIIMFGFFATVIGGILLFIVMVIAGLK